MHRDGAVCTDCVGKRFAWPGVSHRCYRNSVAGSLTVATMAAGHNAAGTWRRKVFRHVTPSHAARNIYLGAGWEGNSISVIPNFVYPDPGPGRGAGGYALFLGRLDVVKGIDTLLSAWQDHGIEYPLKVAGAGPLEGRIRAAAASNDRLEYLGQVNQSAAGELLGDASFVVVPTLGIETFGRVAVEALAKGTPAVVANHGGMRETVADGATGLVFTPGDAADLAAKVKILISDPSKLRALRPACREAYLSRYTGERVLDEWVGLYREAATRG